MSPEGGTLVPQDRRGGWRLLGSGAIGSGGMGTVYKVEHIITKRIEAMKLLASDLTQRLPAGVAVHARDSVQARLHHPNIATVYNAFRSGPHFAMIMELVEGESLAEFARKG